MTCKDHLRVVPAQSRAAAIRNLRHLRDEAVRVAKNVINEGDWQAALDCLYRAEDYERRADAMEKEIPNSSELPDRRQNDL